jgi:hypothetical protein
MICFMDSKYRKQDQSARKKDIRKFKPVKSSIGVGREQFEKKGLYRKSGRERQNTVPFRINAAKNINALKTGSGPGRLSGRIFFVL